MTAGSHQRHTVIQNDRVRAMRNPDAAPANGIRPSVHCDAASNIVHSLSLLFPCPSLIHERNISYDLFYLTPREV